MMDDLTQFETSTSFRFMKAPINNKMAKFGAA